MRKKTQKNGHADTLCFKAIGYPLLCLFALICIIPFFLIIASSFTSESYIIKNGYVLWPKEFSLTAYELIFKNPGKNSSGIWGNCLCYHYRHRIECFYQCHDRLCITAEGF